MTTLEFMEKELNRCKINLEHQETRNAPSEDVENIKDKISHYAKVCEMLKNEGSVRTDTKKYIGDKR